MLLFRLSGQGDKKLNTQTARLAPPGRAVLSGCSVGLPLDKGIADSYTYIANSYV
jgi:hypothetical protein